MKHVGTRGNAKDIASQEQLTFREKLTANRTYYVRTDGSDSNTGLANTSGGAFLTIQKAIDVAAALDVGLFTITIQVGAGTFAKFVCKSFAGAGSINIIGDTTTPSNCVVDASSSGSCVTASSIQGSYFVTGFKLQGASSACINASNSSLIVGVVNFGANTAYCVYASSKASIVFVDSITFSGNSAYGFYVDTQGSVNISPSAPITLSGSIAFSGGFLLARMLSMFMCYSVTITGSATGKRYDISSNSVVFTNGAGASYFPGNSAGTTATGGQYL